MKRCIFNEDKYSPTDCNAICVALFLIRNWAWRSRAFLVAHTHERLKEGKKIENWNMVWIHRAFKRKMCIERVCVDRVTWRHQSNDTKTAHTTRFVSPTTEVTNAIQSHLTSLAHHLLFTCCFFFISSIGWICAAGCSCCRCCFHSTGFLRRDCIVMRTSQFVYIWTCFFPLSLSVSIHLPCSLVSNFRKLLQTMFCCGMSLLPRSLMPFLFFYFVWKWLSQRMEKKFRSWN